MHHVNVGAGDWNLINLLFVFQLLVTVLALFVEKFFVSDQIETDQAVSHVPRKLSEQVIYRRTLFVDTRHNRCYNFYRFADTKEKQQKGKKK
jgi:hypothetical protein